MPVWVGDGDYASVLDDLSDNEGTSRLTVIRMMLQVSSSSPYLMPRLQQKKRKSIIFPHARRKPFALSPQRMISPLLESLSTWMSASANLEVSALRTACTGVEKGRRKVYLRWVEMMAGWKLKYSSVQMVFLVASAWLLLPKAIKDWFWYFWQDFSSNRFIFKLQTTPQGNSLVFWCLYGMEVDWLDVYSVVQNRQVQMQISDIVSPTYSVSSNVLRLNASSVAASTPSCDVERPLVDFQEFSQASSHLPSRPLPKKRLTIDIDEIYDFDQQPPPQKQPEPTVGQTRREEETRMGQSAVECLRLREQLEGQRAKVQCLEKDREFLQKENEQLKTMIVKKDEMLEMRQRALEELSEKLAQVETEVAQERFYDEKLRQKENKYRELKKDHEKIVAMNKSLQRQLRESERKIMDLEKEIQNSVCATQYETLLKVKESSVKLKESSLKVLNPNLTRDNKENAFTNTVKSLDKKKPSTQPKKPTRIATSTLNFAKKLQLKSAVV